LLDTKKKVEGKRSTFDSIKCHFIPSILKDDNQLKGLDEWKEDFDQVIPKCLAHVQNEWEIKITEFHTLLDGIIMLDNGYTKFVVDIGNLLDNRWKSHLVSLHPYKNLSGPVI